MFVALRDLRFARGRFILIGSVVALIAILVGFLSGLTGGLATQSISGVLSLPADRLVFSASSSGPNFSTSSVTKDQAASWAATAGVSSAQPIGITQVRAQSAGNQSEKAQAAITVFGVPTDFDADSPSQDGTLVLSTAAAKELNIATNGELTIAGKTYSVQKVAGDAWFSHTPVVKMTLPDWQRLSAATGKPDAFATILAVTGSPNWSSADTASGTVSQSIIGSLTAVGSFRSEIGSLLLMVTMLFGISGLVVGAFFTVWMMQRKSDIAVLKALGASNRSLIRDALGQTLIVLGLGIGVGIGLVALLGSLAGTALPFLLSPLTTVLPAVIMAALGLAGAAFALRTVTTSDPLAALGSNR